MEPQIIIECKYCGSDSLEKRSRDFWHRIVGLFFKSDYFRCSNCSAYGFYVQSYMPRLLTIVLTAAIIFFYFANGNSQQDDNNAGEVTEIRSKENSTSGNIETVTEEPLLTETSSNSPSIVTHDSPDNELFDVTLVVDEELQSLLSEAGENGYELIPQDDGFEKSSDTKENKSKPANIEEIDHTADEISIISATRLDKEVEPEIEDSLKKAEDDLTQAEQKQEREVATNNVTEADREVASSKVDKDKTDNMVLGEDDVLSANPSHYTLQVLSSNGLDQARDLIESYRSDQKLDHPFYLYQSPKSSQWYPVLYGNFVSEAAARESRAQLPRAMRANKPFIRQFSAIQKIFKEYK